MSESQVHNWLKRTAPPLEKHWQPLAEFFEVSPEYIGLGTPIKMESGVREDAGTYGSGDELRREIRARLEKTMQLAGDDVGRLGWLREQMIRHTSAPEHWDIHEQVIKQVLADERAAEDAKRAQSTRSHGKAS